ncbi:restriction endonuclease subunit S [Streptomyces sp. NPDC102406]|uniref:restriction endonuclease subunit S n=1 Tax=Streptomyces sp. NPDC102406 TaxID=3366171 RepID=UPI003816EF2F
MSDEEIDGQPRDWRRAPLGDLCEVQAGGPSVRRNDHVERGVPLVRPADLRHQRISAGSAMVHIGPDQARDMRKYRIATHDILVSRTGTVGRVALVTADESGWLYNTHLLRVRAHDPADAPYLCAFLSSRRVAEWLVRRAAGTTGMRSITLRTLLELPVALPPLDRQREIGAALKAVDEKIRAHAEIVRATAELRETLSDLLMTGRLPMSP